MSNNTRSRLDPGCLGIIIPFPHLGEAAMKALDWVEDGYTSVYAALPAGSTISLPEEVQPLLIDKLGDGSWRLHDCSPIKTDWVLFLEEDESLDETAFSQLAGTLPSLPRVPHLVGVRRFVPDSQIRQFDWVSTRQLFSAPSANMLAYYTSELRLIPSHYLNELILKEFGENEHPRFSLCLKGAGEISQSKLLPLSLSRSAPPSPEDLREQPGDRELFAKGHGTFHDDSKYAEGFEWPRNIYALVRTDHVPAILKGLKEGVTSCGIVMRTLLYLIRLRNFELAAQFLPFLPEHWEIGNPSILQLKVLIHFFNGETESAKMVLERYHNCAGNDFSVLENVAKFYLLLGDKEQALKLFLKIEDIPEAVQKRPHIGTFIKILRENEGLRPTLSVCVICKDEERLLPRALQSVSGLADEIILVDTGSKDQSRGIAGQFGAKVFDFSWDEDFSEARNYALQQATSDYILMLDADEYLFSLNVIDFHVIKQLLPIKSPLAFSLSIGHFKIETDWMNVLSGGGNFVKESQSVRIFPRLSGLEYHGTVEETVAGSLSQLDIPVITLCEREMRIHHDVFDRERRVSRKLAAHAKEPCPNVRQLLAAVGDSSYLGDREKTIEWLKRLVEKGSAENFTLTPRLGIKLAGLIGETSQQEAHHILASLQTLFPEDRELGLELAAHLIRTGRFSELPLPEICEAPEVKTFMPSHRETRFWIFKGLAALEGGEVDQGAYILDKILSQHPDSLLAQAARFYFLSRIKNLESAASALEDLQNMTTGRKDMQIESPVEFLNAAKELSDTLDAWGHTVERSLILHGVLGLKDQLEVNV